MKKLIVIFVCLFLCSCGETIETNETRFKSERSFFVARIDLKQPFDYDSDEMIGIWVSQFDMHPIYRDGNKQRSKDDYTKKINTMTDNLIKDGFNTVFLQVRPNGDSMYESEFYPTSKYIAGSYGGESDYDAIEIFLDIAKHKGLSVHAWVNPFRLCKESELVDYGKGILYEWYLEGLGKRIEIGSDGLLYLDPAYDEATELIVNGINEILNKYDFDGIHLDDYFYPTEFEFNDDNEFKKSNFTDIGDFRRSNIDRTVKEIYTTVHHFESKVFGIAPAGNIYSLTNGWYVDIYKWLESDGFVDYIMPQLYFGFENATCPFERVLNDWASAVKNDSIKLYIGLSAAKCELGSKGIADSYAGEKGKYEWRDNKNILARSYNEISKSIADGVCIFTYSSFYDPLTGKGNELTLQEHTSFVSSID